MKNDTPQWWMLMPIGLDKHEQMTHTIKQHEISPYSSE